LKIIAFDLSTVCIGCVSAKVIDGKVIALSSAPIIPPEYHSPNFLRSKKHLICGKATINAWAKPGESKITKTEKNRRDVQVRDERDVILFEYIAKEIHEIVSVIKPDVIVVEKNEIFNATLTSNILSKTMGVLLAIGAVNNIPIKAYHVNVVRAPYDVMNLAIKMALVLNTEELGRLKDVTKRAIRRMLEEKYDIKFLSDDESDACLILDYYVNHILTGG